MKKNISKILTKIWGIAVFLLVLIGGSTVLGFIAALIIGGSTGESIAAFIYNSFFSWIIYCTSFLIVIGWIKMELDGEWELTAGTKKKEMQK